MTEELEEKSQNAIYDDYAFVTVEQLDQLGANELVGTKFLQPYMHGYFMDQRLYHRLKAAMQPFAFEEYRKQRKQALMDSKRTWRTRVTKNKSVNVNPDLHKKLQEAADEGTVEGISKKRKEAGSRAQTLLADDRFKVLFEDP